VVRFNQQGSTAVPGNEYKVFKFGVKKKKKLFVTHYIRLVWRVKKCLFTGSVASIIQDIYMYVLIYLFMMNNIMVVLPPDWGDQWW